jgi:polysaccharide biosynthesis protein PslG
VSRLRLVAAALAALVALLLAGCGEDDDPPGPPFGFNDLFQPGAEGNALYEGSGAQFLRTPLNWAAVERSPGEYTWDTYDAIEEELEEVGIEPLWVVTSAPCWAAIVECETPEPSLAPRRDRVDDYARFTAEVAERWPDAFGIELWNEPNLDRFFRESPGPELYNEMLAATLEEFDARGIELPLAIAGMSPGTADEPGKTPWPDYLRAVLASEAAADADAIALHPYSALVPGTDPRTTVREIYEETERIVADAGLAEMPLWATEAGLTTAGQNAVSPEEQARGLVEIVTMLRELGAEAIGVHRFFDLADPPYPAEGGYGVVEADRTTPKPAYCALAAEHGEPCEED